MKIPNIMAPGLAQVKENVRLARVCESSNPHLDIPLLGFYKEICENIKLAIRNI
jgi:aspartate aminotransferase-like enzyme